ncbi:MAG: DNA-binding response regulator [Bacteroidetes bacterium]|nr:DNA-binding response regulator [Bacteroidota bacterium]
MELLIIDDNTDYLHLLKEALNASGYDVHTAEDGVEGCEILATTNIDLIISDIRMPRMDGIKLHSFAREMNRHKSTKFVFLSGYKDVYSNIAGMVANIDFFLDKTTPVDMIVKLVDKLLFGDFAEMWA